MLTDYSKHIMTILIKVTASFFFGEDCNGFIEKKIGAMDLLLMKNTHCVFQGCCVWFGGPGALVDEEMDELQSPCLRLGMTVL